MSRNLLLSSLLALPLAIGSGCDLVVDAGDPEPDPLPAEPTEFAGLVVLSDGPDGSTGFAVFNALDGHGVEVTGAVPDGTCKTGPHTFGLLGRAKDVTPLPVGSQVTVITGGETVQLAKQEVFDTPRIRYGFTRSNRLNGPLARVSWSGEQGGLRYPFDADLVELPEAPTTTTDSVLAVAGEPLTLEWSGAAGDMVVVVFESSDPGTPTITCAVGDTGSATLPASVVRMLSPKHDRMRLDRVKTKAAPYVSENGLDFGAFGVGIRQKTLMLTVEPKRVFVTSNSFSGDLKTAGGGTSGLDGADRLCNGAATEAGLGGTWKAWLSDEATNAFDRIVWDGPWYLLDDRLVFEVRASLRGGPLGGGVLITEIGQAVDTSSSSGWAWTGSDSFGKTTTGLTCAGWTYGGPESFGQGGNVTATDYTWSAHTSHPCNAAARLYCLEE